MNYVFREKFALPNLDTHVREGTAEPVSIQNYFGTMLDQSMTWKTAERIRNDWGGTFCLKGVMSVGDARRAVEIGADAIMISNHGGRQLDGSRAPFDQLREIVDAVGGEIEIICDGGVKRGTQIRDHAFRQAVARCRPVQCQNGDTADVLAQLWPGAREAAIVHLFETGAVGRLQKPAEVWKDYAANVRGADLQLFLDLGQIQAPPAPDLTARGLYSADTLAPGELNTMSMPLKSNFARS